MIMKQEDRKWPTVDDLKDYLLGEDGDIGYLLNSEHDGKIVMLSGAWGSGKTHFWQKEIESKLSKKLKDDEKACVYVSLYGKDNIEVIKSEILQKAYSEIKEENIKQAKAISAFGMGTKILAGISIFGVKVDAQNISDGTKNHYDMKKIEDATEFLSDGGLICFDDFERKSKKIDLNDLFGFISQLAIDMKCKVVIILNSDVFEGKEADVFKTVKEKTVNKFFYFDPTIKDLYDSIYSSNEKYKKLDDYRDKILKAIKETEELNARIYIQVLDNCWEWEDKGYSSIELSNLTYVTIFFSKYHFTLEYKVIGGGYRQFELIKFFEHKKIEHTFIYKLSEANKNMGDEDEIIKFFRNILSDDKDITEKEAIHRDSIFENHKEMFKDLWKYGFRVDSTLTDDYEMLNTFIKTGILLKKDEES